MRVVMLAWLLGGCHMLFQLDEVKPQDGGTGDAPAICDVFVEYVFPGPEPCLPWAHQDSSFNATIEEHDGLFVTPANEYGSRAGCYGDAPVPFKGVVVEVSEVLGGDKGEFTALALSIDRSIAMTNSQLIYQNNNGTDQFTRLAYSQAAMRYWRLRPDSTRANVIAEYSEDGIAWEMLGVPMATTFSSTITVALHAGFNMLQNQGAGRAVFRRLLICN